MNKIRFQMLLDKNQKAGLEKLQEHYDVPVAELVRRAIDLYLKECREKKELPATDEATERLLSVAGICKGGPKDLADGHDKYLYGAPKK